MDAQVQRRKVVGRNFSLLFLAHIPVFSLIRFPVRFTRAAAEDAPHPEPSGASESFTSDCSGRSVVPYRLLPICNASGGRQLSMRLLSGCTWKVVDPAHPAPYLSRWGWHRSNNEAGRWNDTPQVTKQNCRAEKSRMPNSYSRYCLRDNILMTHHCSPVSARKHAWHFFWQPGWFMYVANVLKKEGKHSV